MPVYFCRESTHHACRTSWGDSYGPQINDIELQREETMAQSTFVWTLTQTEMNQTHSDLPHSKYQYRPTELQQSMSGIINHNVHTDVSSNSKQHEPSGCINLQGLGNAPCMQQYKLLFMLMKKTINVLFRENGWVVEYLQGCWSCAISWHDGFH